jgi:hypothetical protein
MDQRCGFTTGILCDLPCSGCYPPSFSKEGQAMGQAVAERSPNDEQELGGDYELRTQHKLQACAEENPLAKKRWGRYP